jgi:peptide/nickel transport system substrate-binding protein
MVFLRKTRFYYWLLSGLVQKYYRQVVFGFIIGFVSVFLTRNTILTIQKQFERETEYIGVVGDYTISNLPLSILSQISGGLTTMNENGLVLPGLAASWETTDSGKTYIFKLKDDALWHDGKNVVSSDINYNITGVDVEHPDDRTIRYHLPSSYSPFLTLLSKPIFKKALIGFGPYKLSFLRYKAGIVQSLTLTPVKQMLPNKTYKFYKTENQVILAYKLGEINRIDTVISFDQSFAKYKNTTVVPIVSHNKMITLFFNLRNDLLTDKNFRQALAYAIPDMYSEKAASPLSKISWAYTDSVRKYPYDISQSKALLESSETATKASELTLHTFTPFLDSAQKIAESWTSIGVKTGVKIDDTLPSDYQVLLTVRDIPSDPDQYALWHSTQSTNITGYNNPKIDKLLEDGRAEGDQEKRKALYVDFQKRLVEDAPALFLAYPITYSIVRK